MTAFGFWMFLAVVGGICLRRFILDQLFAVVGKISGPGGAVGNVSPRFVHLAVVGRSRVMFIVACPVVFLSCCVLVFLVLCVVVVVVIVVEIASREQ